jgi:putative ABC transport system permease protein
MAHYRTSTVAFALTFAGPDRSHISGYAIAVRTDLPFFIETFWSIVSITCMVRFLASLVPVLRFVRNQPGFSALAILTLALGIGVNVAIFSALEAVVINPLPFPEPNRLVAVYEDSSWIGYKKNTPAPANLMDWRRESKSLEDIAATTGCRAVLTGDGAPEEIMCRNVTANLWPVLGVRPILGRWFTAAEDHFQPDVVMIGEGLWTSRFGRDPGILNRTIQIDGKGVQVVGVMPKWFRFPVDMEMWRPVGFTPQQLSQRGAHYLSCYGRLNRGVTIEQASSELLAIQHRLNKLYPDDTNPRMGAFVEPLRDALAGNTRPALWILMGAAGMVLLIACVNVANLMLARATGRQRELAVRAALGASRGDLLGQVFAETLAVASLGGAVGLAFALASRRLLENFIPEALKGSVTIKLDPTVIGFAFLVSLAAALLASLTPSFFIMGVPLMNVLRQDSRSGASRGTVKARAVLVVFEVGVTVMLLAGAGLMVRSLMAIWNTELGFRPAALMTARVTLGGPKYPTDQKRFQFYDRALEAIRAIPGVAAADFASTPPFFSIGNSRGFAIEGRTPANQWEPGDMLTRYGTAGYLQTIGATLSTGRFFTELDRERAPQVVIVNETFARTFYRGESALGKRMSFSGQGFERQWRTIVGVVKEVRERGYDYAPKPVTYLPVSQSPGAFASILVARSRQDSPETLLNSIRHAIQSVDPDLPLGPARTFDETLELDQASRRQQMFLLLAFGSVSLVMACLGIYTMLAYTVELRRQEIGVRLALGASKGDLMRMVTGNGMKLAGLGVLGGIAAALAGARVLRASLYEVQPFDPLTLVAVCGVLSLVALLACWIPAQRAAAIEPAASLRL